MKKIEAIVQPGTKDAVIGAIKKVGVGGVTVHQVQGQGCTRSSFSWSIFQ